MEKTEAGFSNLTTQFEFEFPNSFSNKISKFYSEQEFVLFLMQYNLAPKPKKVGFANFFCLLVNRRACLLIFAFYKGERYIC